MNISEAQYAKEDRKVIRVVIDSITKFVPVDPDNRHYAEIMRQVKEGTLTIKDAD